MVNSIRDLCPRHVEIPLFGSRPSRTPIHPAVVYQCESTEQADLQLAGEQPGYVYQRDGHPNADVLAEKCRQLHQSNQAFVTSSGMAAIALSMVAQLGTGDHIVLSDRLYGRTRFLMTSEANRLGVDSTIADLLDPESASEAITSRTRMVVVETISNPMLRVADLQQLSELAHRHNALLMVDNTFASPVVCQPLAWGADLVVESVTKIMNGHGDVMLGLLCTGGNCTPKFEQRCETVLAAWGFASSPFDCWLAERGIGTLYPRVQMASQSAMWLATEFGKLAGIDRVDYPGLSQHADFEIAKRQFNSGRSTNDAETLFGHIVSIQLSGGGAAADRFIQTASELPFCPSLGELMTTLSHPASTSHRSLSEDQRKSLGILPETVRLSIGLESPEFILDAVRRGSGSSV